MFRAFVFSWLLVLVFSWPSLGQAALPGATGPRLQLLAKPPQLLEIVDIFVYATPEEAARGAVRPNRFPSGTPQLTLDIRVKELKRLGTVIRFEVENAAGRVEINDGFFSFARLEQEGVSSMLLDLAPKTSPYADGPYQLKLFMNDLLVAVLNWSVGILSVAGVSTTKDTKDTKLLRFSSVSFVSFVINLTTSNSKTR